MVKVILNLKIVSRICEQLPTIKCLPMETAEVNQLTMAMSIKSH